uniref:C2H2-type domain-containing protein n=1 Tax=Timema monikensis TaxID=170555 RepID=A0A7R9E4T5_9NEOP|nr:unnamed protein product [Timema monikensis]
MFLMNESLQQNGAHQSHNVPRKHHDIFNIACEKGCNCEAANSIFRTGNGLMFAADKHAATKHFMTPCGPLQLTAQECGEFLLKKVASGNSLANPDAAHINNQNASNESNTVQRKNRQTGVVGGSTGVMHQGTSTENGGKLMPLPTGQKYRVAKERPFSCPECGKSFLLKHHLVTHARVHTGERPHICTECGKSFAHKHCLSTHLLLHSSDRPYKCMECKKSFTLKHHLVTHARVHSRDRPFVCQECGRTFPQKRHLVTHVKFHSGERPYVCEECGESFAQKDHLVIHSRFHGGQHPYVCPDCGAPFARKFELVNHGRLHGRQPHSCEVCGKEFLQKRTLLAHTRLHVEGDRPFVCQHCGETFARKAELTDHSSIHTEEGKSFVCRECGNCFSNREGLALHYRLHASDRNFVADLCDLATAFQQPTAHFLCPQQPGPPPVNKLTAGPTPSTSSGGLGPQLPKPKPHICPDCGKAFTQKHGLAQHHRRHLNGGCDVRQHACDKCGKAFFQKNHLVLHERQHLEHPRGISVPTLALPPPPSENKTYDVGTSTPTE